MTVVVTGAAGQLGKEWTEYLGEQGWSVTPFGSADLDITDRESVFSVLNIHHPEVVINCAAYNNVEDAEDDLESAMSVNQDGVKNLLDWCSDNDAVLIHFSTDYVFPGTRSDSKKYPEGYPEDALRGPVNNYGRSKLAGEEVLLKSNANYILVRVSWLC
jgi:dTDP-4-dehydrorhamnose reductase